MGIFFMRVENKSASKGVKIEIVTVIWVTIEATVAIGAGVLAGSALLTAFGIDSLIELILGGVLLWHLSVEARGRSIEEVEHVERGADWVVVIALALLCLYILVTSIYGLAARVQPEGSLVGIGISLVAVAGMPYLAREKKKISKEMNCKALAGDASCSMVCAYLAGTVLGGLVLNTLFHWWWAEHVAGLFFLYWLMGETKEMFEAIHK
jgi:divalent metal cation (Fe/Co/Zn/Cd) transporter